MQALSVEQSILDGNVEVKKLLEFVRNNAEDLKAYDMEKEIFSRVMQVGLHAMRLYFAERGTGDIGNRLNLEEGVILEKESGLRNRNYFSVFGKIGVARTCYRKAGMPGVMPLDGMVNFPERCYSYLLQEWMDFLSIRDTFKESEITLAKLLGLKVCQSRFEVISRDTCKHYDKFYETKEIPASDSEGEVQALEFDGKGVPVIKKEAAKIKARQGKGEKRQKKKEAMVGVSYTVDKKERSPSEVAKNLVYPEKKKNPDKEKPEVKAKNIRRLASLERSRREIVEELSDDAKQRDPGHKKPLVVVMDGALHLWKLIATVLKGIEYTGILDIIHVTQYLWDAVHAIHGEKYPGSKKWVYDRLLSILQGNVGRVTGGLKQTLSKRKLSKNRGLALKKVITYFENHRQWMEYDKYLSAGYPIGSGIVESTCGHTVKDRMEGTGRRWSINGAEATLLLRSIYTSRDWDEYWIEYMTVERQRLYEKQLEAIGYADSYHKMTAMELKAA